MQFSYIITAITLAMGAVAAPNAAPDAVANPNPPKPSPSPVTKCGNNQKVSCCNDPSGATLVSATVCNLLTVTGSCQTGSTFCCDATQNGLINLNVQCIKLL